jgi:tetratricopeptide (TPR) repeat protein
VSVRSLGAEHPASATSKVAWARYRAESGEIEEAVTQVLEAMPLVRKGYLPPVINRLIASSNAAHIMSLAGRFEDAERYAREALAVAEAARLPENDLRRAEALLQLGKALQGEAKYGEAMEPLKKSAAIYSQAGPAWTESAGRAVALQR